MATNREILFILRARDAASAAIKAMGANWRKLAGDAGASRKTFKDVDQALKDVFRSSEKLRSGSSHVNVLRMAFQNLKKDVLSVDALLGRFVKSTLVGMGTALATFAVGNVIRDMVSTFVGFEKQMSMVKAVSNATAQDFQLLTDKAKEMGATTEFTARQAGSGLEFLVRAGFNAKQATEALPATLNLATAGALDLGRSADIVSNVMSTFQMQTTRASEAADILATVNSSANTNIEQLAEALKYAGPIASGFGVSLNETAAAIGVLGDSGIQGTLAGTGVRMALIDSKMLALGTHTKRAQETFKALKIDPKAFDPEKVGIKGMVKALIDAHATTADLTNMFGARAAPSVLTMMRAFQKLESLTDKTATNVGEAARQAAVARDNLLGDWQALRSAIEGLFINIGEFITPALRTIVQFATSVVQAIQGATITSEKFKDVFTVLTPIIHAVAMAFAAMGIPALISLLASAAMGFLTLAGSMLTIVTGAGGVSIALRGIGAAFMSIPIIGWIAAAIVAIQWLMGVTFEWKGVTMSVGDVVKTIFSNIADWISEKITFIKLRMQLWVHDAMQAVQGLSGIYDVVSSIFTAIADFVIGWVNGEIGMIVGLVNSIGVILGNLPAVFRVTFGSAINIAITIMEAGLNKILDGFKKFLGAIDAVVSKVGGSSDLAGKIGTVDMSGFKIDVTDDAKDLGKQLSEGWQSAQKDYVREMTTTATAAAKAVGDAAVNVLTPSLNQTALSIREATAARKDEDLSPPTAPPKAVDTSGDGVGIGGGDSGGGGRSKTENDKKNVLADTIAKYKEEVQLAQFTGRELEIQKALLEAQNEAKRQGIVLSAQQLEQIRQAKTQALNATDAREMIDGYRDLMESSVKDGLKAALNGDDMGNWISNFGKKLRDMAIDNFVDIIFGNKGGTGLSGIGGAGGGTGQGGGGIMGWISSLFSGGGNAASGGGGGIFGWLSSLFGGGAGGGFGSFFSSLFSLFGFDKGGIMSALGPIRTYSTGGIARSPQLAMFGEGSTPEAYVPVPSGRIPVEMRGHGGSAGGNRTINTTFNVSTPNADSFRRSQPQIMARAARQMNRQSQRNN